MIPIVAIRLLLATLLLTIVAGAMAPASELGVLAEQDFPEASTPPAPSTPADPATAIIFNYNKVDKACRAWSDGCRNCMIEAEGGGSKVHCSNIGIACQPGEIKCGQRDAQ